MVNSILNNILNISDDVDVLAISEGVSVLAYNQTQDTPAETESSTNPFYVLISRKYSGPTSPNPFNRILGNE